MKSLFYWTIGFCLALSLQVNCDDSGSESYSIDLSSLAAGISEFARDLDTVLDELEQNPIHVRSKRSTDSDECHTLQTKSLPAARQSIYGAWNTSIDAVVTVATAVNDAKKCASWNIFESVPCGIKAVVEFYKAFRDNKNELYKFFSDIKEASADTTVDFVGCAKILLARRNKPS